MKVVLIGATGFVGNAILNELTDRNYNVVAIARNTDKIENNSDTIEKINADVFNSEDISKAISGADLVISAYNPGWTNPNIADEYRKGAESIQKAVENSDVKRLIVIGGAGTLKIDGNYLVDGADFSKDIYPAANSVRNYFVENLSKNETLDWEFFSPAIEMYNGNGLTKTKNYRYGSDAPVFNAEGRSLLSVEDLAVAVVDEVENKQFIRKQFTAGY